MPKDVVPDTFSRAAESVPDTKPKSNVDVFPDTRPPAAKKNVIVPDAVLPAKRNWRPYTGQPLGIKLPNGSVEPFKADNSSPAVIGGRVLDLSPLTGHPILEL